MIKCSEVEGSLDVNMVEKGRKGSLIDKTLLTYPLLALLGTVSQSLRTDCTLSAKGSLESLTFPW